MNHYVRVKSIAKVTHDVLQIIMEKPDHLDFVPGQAAEVSINKEKWKEEKRPFTFTSLPSDDYLQFTIKTYPSHNGVTNEMLQLNVNDELILHDVFGAIHYKGEGVFIAGGAGVTPFISIFRSLHAENKIGNNILIFANKTSADIILEHEFRKMLGNNFINILSEEKTKEYAYGQVTSEFIEANSDGLNKMFYLCGPPPMMDAVEKQLANLNIHEKLIVKEAF